MRSFSNYQKISEITTIDNEIGTNPNPFDGDGLPFKGKLIGMEDLSADRDEKVCLDCMIKLKNAVRVRGEHKQKIQLNLSLNGVQVIDESTKVPLASHEIERISFVITDPYDPRAFGYIYNTTDDRHQFWAIKTDRIAQTAVLALKDLFDEAFKHMKNLEQATTQVNQTTSTPVSFYEVTVSTQQSPSELTPVFTPQPPIQSTKSVPPIIQVPTTVLFDDAWGGNLSATVPQPLPTSQQQSTFDNDPWGGNLSATAPQTLQTSQQQLTFDNDAWGFSEPVVPVKQSAPSVENSPVNAFSLPPPPPSRRATITQQPTSTAGTSDLFPLFTTAPPTSAANNNVFIQSTQPTSFVSQQQPNFLDSMPASSIVLSTAKDSFGEFDLLGDFSSGSAVAKPSNELFFSSPASARPMQ